MTINMDTAAMSQDVERIMISEEELQRRVRELGLEISRDYAGKPLMLVSVLKGGIVFLADLMRRIDVPHEIELVGASRYRGGVTPTPGVLITKDVDLGLDGRHVLMVEDIYDTGNTLQVVHNLLQLYRPASLEVCALLRKKKSHSNPIEVRYVGFDIDDIFVVGYGLDYKEQYRNLPYIGVLKAELYE